MVQGNVVEYIDRQKIMCAVILEVKKHRLRVLTETNREVNLSASRLSHKSKTMIDLSLGRDTLVETLKDLADKRNNLINLIDIKELWEILNTEQEWIDIATMTEFCFPHNPTDNHESAVVRAFFENRIYFKFNHDRFFPYSQEQVEKIIGQTRENARKNRIIQEGSDWLKRVLNDKKSDLSGLPDLFGDQLEFANILKSIYILGKESKYYSLGKEMLDRAGIDNVDGIFQVLVNLKVLDKDENLDLHRYDVSTHFPDEVMENATSLAGLPHIATHDNRRKDLTMLPLMTIDGQATLDYDDAISIEEKGDHYLLGIHIADVGHFIKKGDIIDREALGRGSSIYLPDLKVPMLPPCLTEDLCSLKAGELRPAISIMVKLNNFSEILEYEILPSLVRVKSQLTYYDVNMVSDKKSEIVILHDIAKEFRQTRLASGAVQITLPEINVRIDDDGEITLVRINRESPGRMLVSEIMIMANWLMGKFLAEHDVPTIYRSQPAPRERLYKGIGGTLFQNCMQRKMLSRFVLSHEPEYHSGLGLNLYTTATSPIRKYYDLVTQRQIRAVFGMEEPYSSKEIQHMIQILNEPVSKVAKIQYNRHRYWKLKHLEKRRGQKEEAIVLYKRRNNYLVVIPEYMIECDLPLTNDINLKPQDLVQVTIQHVNASKDAFSIFIG